MAPPLLGAIAAPLIKAAIQIIVAETQRGSFLQRSWRPIPMLAFVGLILASWLGFTAPGG